jgi:hypothetical protein
VQDPGIWKVLEDEVPQEIFGPKLTLPVAAAAAEAGGAEAGGAADAAAQ